MDDTTRTRTCLNCAQTFSYEVGPGRDRKHCTKDCARKYHRKLAKKLRDSLPECKVNGCKNKATRKTFGLCETHYYRMRRTGTTDTSLPKFRYVTDAGYIKILDRRHPLADKRGQVFEHRKVLYDKIGPGEHLCFWCGKKINWKIGIVDHLNDKKGDNRPENLVLTCNNCNRARGALTPFLKRMKITSFPAFIEACNQHIGGVP